jgi:hypothetical protein
MTYVFVLVWKEVKIEIHSEGRTLTLFRVSRLMMSCIKIVTSLSGQKQKRIQWHFVLQYNCLIDFCITVEYIIDFEKGRTGHGISDLSYYGLFWPSLLQ